MGGSNALRYGRKLVLCCLRNPTYALSLAVFLLIVISHRLVQLRYYRQLEAHFMRAVSESFQTAFPQSIDFIINYYDKTYSSYMLRIPPEKEDRFYMVITFFPVVPVSLKVLGGNSNNPEISGRTKDKVQRQKELDASLQRNLDNVRVALVFVLQEKPDVEQYVRERSLRHSEKLVFVTTFTNLTYRHSFEFCSRFLINRTVLISNQDVYLGEGWERVTKTNLVRHRVAYALSRHGRNESFCDVPDDCGPHAEYVGSHDMFVLVLVRPLPPEGLAYIDFMHDNLGVENIVVFALRENFKLRVINPCRVVRIYHLHCANVHRVSRPRINNGINTGMANFTDALF